MRWRPPERVQDERSMAEAMAAWGAVVYAEPGWSRTKDRYWRSRWTPRRCVWCRTPRGLQLNHLTYVFARRFRGGWTPLWTLLPLCARCHGAETRWTRALRNVTPRLVDLWAHAVVTVGVWAVSRGALLVGVWAAWGWLR
jgi:hypothetical protein